MQKTDISIPHFRSGDGESIRICASFNIGTGCGGEIKLQILDRNLIGETK